MENALSARKGPQPVAIHLGRRRRQQRAKRAAATSVRLLRRRLYLEVLAIALSLVERPRLCPFFCSIGIQSNTSLALRDRSEEEKVQEEIGEKSSFDLLPRRAKSLAMGEKRWRRKKSSFVFPFFILSFLSTPTTPSPPSPLRSPNSPKPPLKTKTRPTPFLK